MPIYDFKCNICETVFEISCSISLKDNQICPECGSNDYNHHFKTTPAMGDSVRLGIRRTDDGFREVLSKIGQNNYRSNLGNKLSRK